MKKFWILSTLIILIGLLFATTQAMASPAIPTDLKRTPERTPGAKATEKGIQRATEGKGNGSGNAHGKRVNFKGMIASVDAGSLTVALNDGSSVTVALTEETRIRIPTLGNNASVADLQPGLRVNVQAVGDDTSGLTARFVLVVPGKPVQAHKVGMVTDYQPGISITIQASDGAAYTYLLTAETRILPAERQALLAVGARVTVIAPRDVTTLDLVARGIVVHPAQTDGATEP